MIFQGIDYTFSYSKKNIEGILFFSDPNLVEKIDMYVFQDRGMGKRRKKIGACELTCQGATEIKYSFGVKPVFEQIFPVFAEKLQETHEFIQVESASYDLEIICKWGNQVEIIAQKIKLST